MLAGLGKSEDRLEFLQAKSGESNEDDDEMVDSCEVNTEDDVDTSMDVSSFCCCLSAHLLNKSLPFLLDVLWTTVSALLASRPVGRMLVPSLLEELDPD